MKQLTSNVLVETGLKGANHGVVTTSDGVVLIDTPHKPSDAVRLKGEIERLGRLRYIINTEPHGDHWTGNAFFNVPVVAHEGVRARILGTDLAAHVARVASFGPEEPKLLENYKPNAPVITFQSEMTFTRGQSHLPHGAHAGSHALSGCRHCRRRGRRFYQRQHFLQGADLDSRRSPEHWLKALESLRALREETFVPGHGPVCDKRYLDEQGSFISEWVEYVRGGIERGMNKEECVANLTALTDRYPMDVGQDGMSPRVMQMNVINLYDYLTSAGIHKRG